MIAVLVFLKSLILQVKEAGMTDYSVLLSVVFETFWAVGASIAAGAAVGLPTQREPYGLRPARHHLCLPL